VSGSGIKVGRSSPCCSKAALAPIGSSEGITATMALTAKPVEASVCAIAFCPFAIACLARSRIACRTPLAFNLASIWKQAPTFQERQFSRAVVSKWRGQLSTRPGWSNPEVDVCLPTATRDNAPSGSVRAQVRAIVATGVRLDRSKRGHALRVRDRRNGSHRATGPTTASDPATRLRPRGHRCPSAAPSQGRSGRAAAAR
jgi:hypothetical protein